jgi:pyruvate formate lyase activating enzyme
MTKGKLDRRSFVTGVASGVGAACLSGRAAAEDQATGRPVETGREVELSRARARWWKTSESQVVCGLCPRACRVGEGQRGACGVRENRGGQYQTLVYGRPCAMHLDPIEKKPFYHVLPGQTAFSLGAPGCNFACKFCQNWEISQARPEQVPTFDAPPSKIVSLARARGAPTIACTYSEPTVWSEYVYDIAKTAKPLGLRTLLVSNGFIQPQPMQDLMGVLGAVKIDLKAFTETFYRDQCRGELKPVLDTLRLLVKRKVWTEIVMLVIPGLNDGATDTRALVRFVRDELGPEVPLHLTRFHPSYRLMNVPSTPVSTLTRLRDLAQAEGLRFVYVGNVPGHPGNHTYCPSCRQLLIRRVGIAVVTNRLQAGKCPNCGRPIPGIF